MRGGNTHAHSITCALSQLIICSCYSLFVTYIFFHQSCLYSWYVLFRSVYLLHLLYVQAFTVHVDLDQCLSVCRPVEHRCLTTLTSIPVCVTPWASFALCVFLFLLGPFDASWLWRTVQFRVGKELILWNFDVIVTRLMCGKQTSERPPFVRHYAKA